MVVYLQRSLGLMGFRLYSRRPSATACCIFLLFKPLKDCKVHEGSIRYDKSQYCSIWHLTGRQDFFLFFSVYDLHHAAGFFRFSFFALQTLRKRMDGWGSRIQRAVLIKNWISDLDLPIYLQLLTHYVIDCYIVAVKPLTVASACINLLTILGFVEKLLAALSDLSHTRDTMT